MLLKQGDVILFQGDSITDCGRNREEKNNLGWGYPFLAASLLQHRLCEYNLTFFNRGISGDRVCDLERRWQADCIDLEPTVVSIMIGINNVWRRYDQNDPTPPDVFEAGYRNILTQVRQKLDARLVVMEPFVNPYPEERIAWREDLDPKLEVVRRLAKEFDAVLVPLDGAFAQAYNKKPGGYYAGDGVHPSHAGNALIAEEWIKAVME